MRTISRLLQTVWLVLCGLVFTLPVRPFLRDPVRARYAWQGATEGWSPKAAVEAVEHTSAWDVAGWLDDGQRELHEALDEIEKGLRACLIDVRERVYEWRDGYAVA